jgi:hypothetical protein
MALVNGYVSLPELKGQLGVVDANSDAALERVIGTVSRWIDKWCGRRFWVNAADEARYYTARFSHTVYTDDIVSVTTLGTDDDGDRAYENTWASTDYDLRPDNAALDGAPYTCIAVAPNGVYSFPSGVAKGVKILGKFGWSTTLPDLVREACLIQCTRVYRRRDAPFGITGANEMGQSVMINRLDPDVTMMLDTYRRISVG